jgi:hypothetical protein
VPGDLVPLERHRLDKMPASYRMLAYYFDVRGYDVNLDMPGDDRPEVAAGLLSEAVDWLHS